MATITITGTVGAYITEYSGTKLHHLFEPGADASKLLAGLTWMDGGADYSGDGWVKVGTATVTLEVQGQDALVTEAVAALRKRQQDILAAAQAAAMQIGVQIQSLLAITHDPAAIDEVML